MAYRFIDKRGQDTYRNSVRAGGLYPNPNRTVYQNRPRFYSVADTPVAFNASDRSTVIRYGRELFVSSPNLNGAVRQKASFSVLDSFSPRFRGSDFAWGEQVEDWLKNKFFPIANVRGGNYNFANSLFAISVALDVDGDCLIYLQQSRDGFPQFGVVPSHRIGQRSNTDKAVTEGRFKGYRITDGVITNSNGRAIGYRILGDKADDDYDISAQSSMLLFESPWSDAIRGVSNFGSILIDALNSADIDFFLQQGVKLDSAVGLLAYTQNGEADPSTITNPILAEDESPLTTPVVSAPGIGVEPLLGGLINYFKANSGEKLEAFHTDRPHANVENFCNRLERRCMYGLGWPYEMLNATQIGGASVRLVQSEARNAIRSRQATLARAARFIVAYAVAVGMQNELIPNNQNGDWYNWQFNTGPLLTVDNGYEADADRKGLLLGTKTLEQVAANNGQDWYEMREQQTKEAVDLVTRAQDLTKKFPALSLNQALSLLSQRSPNESPALIPSTDEGNPVNN